MDEIDKLARQVARAPRDPEAIRRLARAVEAATGRKVEVHSPGGGPALTHRVANDLVAAGMRLTDWLSIRRSHDLRTTMLHPENIAWIEDKARNLKVNWSELAMHSRAAGADIVVLGAALTENGGLLAAAAWVDLEKGTAGFVDGVGTEVFTPALDRYVRSYLEG